MSVVLKHYTVFKQEALVVSVSRGVMSHNFGVINTVYKPVFQRIFLTVSTVHWVNILLDNFLLCDHILATYRLQTNQSISLSLSLIYDLSLSLSLLLFACCCRYRLNNKTSELTHGHSICVSDAI